MVRSFSPELCFADFETLSPEDVTQVGAYKYAHHPETDATVLAFTFNDNQHGHIWSPDWAWTYKYKFDQSLEALHEHVRTGGYVIYWNAGFDRHIWNEVMVKKYGWPVLPLEQVLCAQAQAEANNLPGKLEFAAKMLGTHYQKDPKGKSLIKLLANGTRSTWNAAENNTPERMGHFRAYGLKDVLSMRDVWNQCRPLTAWEWNEYHASERINDRGVAVDVEFAEAAMQYALAEAADLNVELKDLTGDPKMTVGAHLRKAEYLHDQLYPDGDLQAMTEKPPLKKSPDKPRYTCDARVRETILELITGPDHSEAFEPDHLAQIVRFLELIEAGNSAAVKKFTAIVKQEIDGRVHGGYSFNGAGQTGRYSSRGIQVHNIIRAPVEYGNPNRAIDAVEDILDGLPAEELAEKYGYPISRLLARLIRPTFVAPEGKMLIWGDWDQIEARKLPWLARSAGAERKLDLFRSGQDVYKYAASPIFNVHPDNVDDDQRQVGKVSELALGFGGSVGAFTAMGRGYGVIVPPAQAKLIVDKWRSANQWCVEFWNQLWKAALDAYANPGVWQPAGRVKYLFHPGLMGGTLICELPCTRWIVYPKFRHKYETLLDENDVPYRKWRTSYVRGFGGGSGRVDLWRGKLAENITQASAASILRRALVDMDTTAVLHTHDEIVLEVHAADVDMAKEYLRETMMDIPEWAKGCPLTASIESGPFYTK